MGRALIVDDNPANRKLLEAFCHAFGLTADCADSGAQALELFAQHDPGHPVALADAGAGAAAAAAAAAAKEGLASDSAEESYGIVLMDIHMPGMDGVETARRLMESGGRTVPIVAVTADTTPENHARCLEVGMTDVVHKPVSVQLLAPILCRYFEF